MDYKDCRFYFNGECHHKNAPPEHKECIGEEFCVVSNDDASCCENIPLFVTLEELPKYKAAPDMYEALKEAKLQIEYLQNKFQKTGSGNAVLSLIDSVLAKANKQESK